MEAIEQKQVESLKGYSRLPLTGDGKLIDLGDLRLPDPKNLIIIKYPKSGSTLSICNVPKILIADSERGTEYFNANNKVDLIDSNVEGEFENTKKYGYIPKTIYDSVLELQEANKMIDYWNLYNKFSLERDFNNKKKMHEELINMINSMPFPIVAIDTITSLVGLSNTAALYEYNLGVRKESQKTDIKRVDDYGGVQYSRRKFQNIKDFIEHHAAPFIQYHGHVGTKKKILKKGEEDIDALDIALDGILSIIFTSKADSVATFYRDETGCYLDFTKKDETSLGSRPFHLSNKKIKIAEILKDKEEFPQTHWDLIYPSINFNKK